MLEKGSRSEKRIEQPRTSQSPRAEQSQIEKATNKQNVFQISTSQMISDFDTE